MTEPTPGPEADPGPEATPEPTEEQIAERRVRVNRATRGALAAVLGLEAFAVLLVPRAIAQTPTGLGGLKTGLLVGLAAVLVGTASVQRRRWGIALGSLMQVPVVAIGVWTHAFFVAAALFVGVWLYVLNIRHDLVGTPGGPRMLIS